MNSDALKAAAPSQRDDELSSPSVVPQPGPADDNFARFSATMGLLTFFGVLALALWLRKKVTITWN